jgi:hypothetical protein
MKATEIKAKELVEMFSTLEYAVKCVKEIIKNNELIKKYLMGGGVVFENTEFWQEVLTILKAM